MTNSDVKRFREALEATVIEIDSSMRRRDGIIIEGNGDEFDRMHRATERDLAVRTLEALSSHRRAALAALRRIEEGTYGICVECEDPISSRRLAALPAAALCIRCQEARDCSCEVRNRSASLATAA
jgi:DnaK suppressor protein